MDKKKVKIYNLPKLHKKNHNFLQLMNNKNKTLKDHRICSLIAKVQFKLNNRAN